VEDSASHAYMMHLHTLVYMYTLVLAALATPSRTPPLRRGGEANNTRKRTDYIKMLHTDPPALADIPAPAWRKLKKGGRRLAAPTPLKLHRIGPTTDQSKWPEAWRTAIRSWRGLGAVVSEYHDDDLMTVIAEAFPSLASKVGAMRTVIEKTDICRLAVMHVHGGIYADLDQELVSVEKMQELLASGRVYLPFEKGRLVGQAILISPPGHPLWATLAHSMMSQYDPRCYETMNTGPDKLTALWNEAACAPSLSEAFRSVSLHEGLDSVGGKGAIVRHLRTGSWKRKRNNETEGRKAGRLGCTFARMNVTCFTLGDVVTKLRVPPQLKHALSVDKPMGQVLYDGGKPPRYGYDNAMSINGVRLASGEERFVARLCDANCTKGPGKLKASTIAFGGMVCGSGGSWSGPCRWTRAREVRVGLAYPKDRAWLNGPEDARIDVLKDDKLFALANVPSESCGHGTSWSDLKMRDVAYIPLSESADGEPGAIACRIQVKRTEPCRREKNWSPLVIDGRIYVPGLLARTLPGLVLRHGQLQWHGAHG